MWVAGGRSPDRLGGEQIDRFAADELERVVATALTAPDGAVRARVPPRISVRGFLMAQGTAQPGGRALPALAGGPPHPRPHQHNSFKAYRRDFLERTPVESTAGFSLGLELIRREALGWSPRILGLPVTYVSGY